MKIYFLIIYYIMNNFSEEYKTPTLNFLYSLKSKYGIEYRKKINQSGGKLDFKTFRYMDNKFNVKIDDDDKKHIIITVVAKDGNDCVTVFIYNEENIAIIHNMSYYSDCAVDGLKHPGGGDLLFRFILSFIIINKDKYKINRIVLQDQSFLACGENSSVKIALSRLRIVTHGQPWPGACPLRSTEYMKYDFKPYNPLKRVPDKNILQRLDFNIKMLEKMKTKDINIWKIVNKFDNVDNTDRSEIKNMIDTNLLFKDFIKDMSKNFYKYCPLIDALLEKVYAPLIDGSTLLYDFYGQHYYLDI